MISDADVLAALRLALEWMGMESIPGATCEQEEQAIAKVQLAIAQLKARICDNFVGLTADEATAGT